jgi:hypothetical protein
MKKEETITRNEVLINSSIPASRIASAFMIFFGMIVSIVPQFAENRDEVGPFVMTALFIFGALFIWGGYALGNAAKRIDLYFRHNDQSLCIERKGWFSSAIERETFAKGQIRNLEIIHTTDSEGSDQYQLVLGLPNGKTLPLTEPLYSKEYLLERRKLIDDAIFHGGTQIAKLKKESENKHKIPAPVKWFTALVLTLPFISMLFGHFASFAGPVVNCGIPDNATVSTVHSMILPVLHDSTEKILWVGQPEPEHEQSLKIWLLIPFAMVWTLFSFSWTYLAWLAANSEKNPIGYLLVLFGLPFICIGLGLLVSPYLHKQYDLNTVYALTDQGAIKFLNGKAYRIAEFKNDSNFGPIEVDRYKQDRADIMFWTDRSEGSRHPSTGFYGVQKADLALEIMERFSGQRAASKR